MTIETSYSQARENLKSLMDKAIDDREIVIVKRRSGGDVAMIAADELQGLVDSAHLLRSPKNAERLLMALVRATTDEMKPSALSSLEKLYGVDV